MKGHGAGDPELLEVSQQALLFDSQPGFQVLLGDRKGLQYLYSGEGL